MKYKLFNKRLFITTCLFTLTGSYSYYKNSFTSSHKPSFIDMLLYNKSLQCKEFHKDEVSSITYSGNSPCEDRHSITNLVHMKNALFLSVFDGHGGFQLSDYANIRLASYVDEIYKSLSESTMEEKEKVVTALKEAFNKIEMEFKQEAIKLYNKGNGKSATVGSCALAAIIYKDVLYVANLGDSKARLFRYDNINKDIYGVKLMNTHNSEKPKEKEALFKKFPNENDIVVCKRPNGTVCYVKGRLQPTRSLGDFHLKYKEFNQYNETGYKKPIPNFNGPYISAIPEITVYDIDYTRDRYLLLATDGLFDFIRTTEIADYILYSENNNYLPTSADLLKMVLNEAARNAKISVDELKKIPYGKRRNYHDDTTILLLNLNLKI